MPGSISRTLCLFTSKAVTKFHDSNRDAETENCQLVLNVTTYFVIFSDILMCNGSQIQFYEFTLFSSEI